MGIDSALFPYRSVSAGGDSEGANVPLSGFDHHDPIWCYQKQGIPSVAKTYFFAGITSILRRSVKVAAHTVTTSVDCLFTPMVLGGKQTSSAPQ